MVNYENPVTTPAPGQTLAASQAPILNDFQYLKAFGNKDHNFSSDSLAATDGYHKLIHTVDQNLAAFPAPIAGSGQLFSSANTVSLGGGNQLFYVSDTGGVQFTNGARASNGASGWTCLPGGMMMQWGTATVGTDGAVAFYNSNSKPFTAVFSIQCTVFENNNNRHFVSVKTVTIGSPGQFTVSSRDSGGNNEVNTFYWVAIGSMA